MRVLGAVLIALGLYALLSPGFAPRLFGSAGLIGQVTIPSSVTAYAAAGSVSVSPTEVRIDDLSPGVPVDFDLTIYNEEGLARVFVLTIYQPPEESRRDRRDEFPDNSWIGLSHTEVEVGAESESSVRVTVAVPQEQAFMGKDWEVWLGVTPQSGELLSVRYYVRLLISTKSEAEGKCGRWLVAGIVMASIIAGYSGYHYLRRRTERE